MKEQNILLTYISLIFFCIPTAAMPGWFTAMISAGRLAGFCWSALLFVEYGMYQKKQLCAIGAFLAAAAVSTLLSDGSLKQFVIFAGGVFACSVCTCRMISMCGRRALNMIAVLLSVLVVIQGITILTGGIKEEIDANNIRNILYFFGHRVAISDVLTYSFALALLAYPAANRRERVLHILGILAGTGFALYEKVSTAIITVLVFAAVAVGVNLMRGRRRWQIICIALLVFALVFVLSGGFTRSFGWLLSGLGEDMTMNGRTLLWAQALDQMSGADWLIGHGYGHSVFFNIGNWYVNTAHSQYMNVMFDFGILGTVPYIVLCCRNLFDIRKIADNRRRAVAYAAIIAVVVTGIPTTIYKSVFFYIYLVIIGCWDELEIPGQERGVRLNLRREPAVSRAGIA